MVHQAGPILLVKVLGLVTSILWGRLTNLNITASSLIRWKSIVHFIDHRTRGIFTTGFGEHREISYLPRSCGRNSPTLRCMKKLPVERQLYLKMILIYLIVASSHCINPANWELYWRSSHPALRMVTTGSRYYMLLSGLSVNIDLQLSSDIVVGVMMKILPNYSGKMMLPGCRSMSQNFRLQ